MGRFTSILLVASFYLGLTYAEYPNFDVTKDANGYRISGPVVNTNTGLQFPLSFNDKGSHGLDYFGKTIKDLKVTVDYETEDRLRVLITDGADKQFLVPNTPLGFERPSVQQKAKNTNYEFKYTNNPFGFKVIRKSDGEVIFDTTEQPLVFEDQYLELTSKLPNEANLYGLGEVTAPFRRNNIKNITTIFNADAATPMNRNIYGAHPYYMEIRDSKAHGVLLLNAHGMDVFTVEGRITYKILGGGLEFYFFTPKQPTPNQLATIYTDLIGKPFMLAHWMLGWQQCRYGYQNISVVEDVVTKYKKANIPLEIAWIDIDYMDHRKDFTTDPVNFPMERMIQFSKQLHKDGQKFVLMVDPAISTNSSYGPYERGVELDVFVRNPDGTEYQGQVWPGYTVFPDWWSPNAEKYWDYEIGDFMKKLNLDSLWIDMNEASSFCVGSCGTGKVNSDPPLPWLLPQEEQDKLTEEQTKALIAQNKYLNDTRNMVNPNYSIYNVNGNLSVHGLSTTAQFYGNITFYDIKNLYGHAMAHFTKKAMVKHNPTNRTFSLTRSTFVGTGKNAGHWTGDNFSQWDYLRVSIATVFSMQLFGISYSGADVCGFNGNTTEELCTRWSQVGAFYPFARNHNAIGEVDQYPYLWESTAEASRKSLAVRYSLLPLFYTLHEESSRLGTGVWRPLINEYPHIDAFLDNDVQFLIGTDVLVSPVVTEGARSVDAYFPLGLWYDWYDYSVIKSTKPSKPITLQANLTHIPVHLRGGSIVPTKTPEYLVSTTYASPYVLLVSLDNNNSATGALYVDDGISLEQKQGTSHIQFTFKNGIFKASGDFGYHGPSEPISTIKIIGGHGKYAGHLKKAKYQNKSITLSHPSPNVSVLENISISLDQSFTVSFN